MSFVKATKKQAKLRLNLNGPAGAGKTYSALAIAKGLGGKTALIDTERGSASKYADKFDFDVEELFDNYHPDRLIKTLEAASGYDNIIVDSLSHFWNGKGGMLDLAEQEVQDMKARGHKADSYAAWKKVTPIYNALIQKLLGLNAHLICTARAKMDYEKDKDERGKTVVVAVGLAPELRDGWQYEFDVEGMLTRENVLIVGKTRCPDLKGKTFKEPGAEFSAILKRWLEDGAPAPIVQPAAANDNAEQLPTANVAALARAFVEIEKASDLLTLEEIGSRIAKAPPSFQRAVEKAYAKRENELVSSRALGGGVNDPSDDLKAAA